MTEEGLYFVMTEIRAVRYFLRITTRIPYFLRGNVYEKKSPASTVHGTKFLTRGTPGPAHHHHHHQQQQLSGGEACDHLFPGLSFTFAGHQHLLHGQHGQQQGAAPIGTGMPPFLALPRPCNGVTLPTLYVLDYDPT